MQSLSKEIHVGMVITAWGRSQLLIATIGYVVYEILDHYVIYDKKSAESSVEPAGAIWHKICSH